MANFLQYCPPSHFAGNEFSSGYFSESGGNCGIYIRFMCGRILIWGGVKCEIYPINRQNGVVALRTGLKHYPIKNCGDIETSRLSVNIRL